MEDIDVIVLCAKRGVAIPQPVNHGAARDDDWSKECVDAVLKCWWLKQIEDFIQTHYTT